MAAKFEILYVHVRPGTKKFEPGHWFFDTGEYAVCADARRDKGKWIVNPRYSPKGTPLPEEVVIAGPIDNVMMFVAEHFGRPVRRVSTRELPRLEGL